MKVDILTLFPGMYEGFLSESIIKRAIESNKVAINIANIRDFSNDKHKKVDDTPYGGGSGMVMMCQPIFDAVESLKKENSKVILMTPAGERFNQQKAYELSEEKHLILIAGHYEGFDERIRTIADMEISIGDYVLTGGELPTMVVTDSVVRLIDGVIDEESHLKESFNEGLLDYPTYTKPQQYKGMDVPEVLLSGHHKNIENWRQTERIIKTMEKRPDLINKKRGYYLSKDPVSKEITYIEYDKLNGLDITPRNDAKRDDVISVTKMMLIKPSFVEKVTKLKIARKLKYFIDKISNIDEEDATPEEITILIEEIEIYKNSLLNYYLNFLGIEYKNLTLQKLQLILNELKVRKNLVLTEKDNQIGGKAR